MKYKIFVFFNAAFFFYSFIFPITSFLEHSSASTPSPSEFAAGLWPSAGGTLWARRKANLSAACVHALRPRWQRSRLWARDLTTPPAVRIRPWRTSAECLAHSCRQSALYSLQKAPCCWGNIKSDEDRSAEKYETEKQGRGKPEDLIFHQTDPQHGFFIIKMGKAINFHVFAMHIGLLENRTSKVYE